MDREEIDLLIEICDFYSVVADTLGVENKLNKSMVMDTLLRLKNGEKIVKDNPDW